MNMFDRGVIPKTLKVVLYNMWYTYILLLFLKFKKSELQIISTRNILG